MANSAEYKRRSPPAFDSSLHLEEPGDSVVDDCHLPEPQLFNPRKRQRSERRSLQLNDTSQSLSERQKLSYSTSESRLPAAFWDNLSKLWLTKRTLRELDRRNTQLAPSPPRSSYRRPHRPVTRRALAELKKRRQLSQTATDFLCHCAPRRLKDIKLFARHGGPDLSDLRGVCITKYLLVPMLTIPFLVPEPCEPSLSHNELEPV